MTGTTAIRLWSVAFAWLLLGSDAAAQTPAQSFADLQPLLKPGQRVIVTDAKNVETTGRVVSILGNQLEIDQGRRQLVFSEDTVRWIVEDDSNWNGALIGAGVGLVLAVVATLWISERETGFLGTGGLNEAEVAGALVSLGLVGIFGGSYLGGQIDGGIHRVLYLSPRKSNASIAPLLGFPRVGVAATIRF